MNIDEFKKYLEKIHAHDRFDYENDDIKSNIVECMKFGGRREKDYIQIFKQILTRIKNGAGAKAPDRKNGKSVNLIVDDVKDWNMIIFFEPIESKNILGKTERFKIYKIVIVDRKASTINKTLIIIFP